MNDIIEKEEFIMGTIKRNLAVKEPFEQDYCSGRIYAMPDVVTSTLTGPCKNVLALQVPNYNNTIVRIWSLPWNYLVNPDNYIIKPYDGDNDVPERCHVACVTLFSLLVSGEYDKIRELSRENSPDIFSGWSNAKFEDTVCPGDLIRTESYIPDHIVDNLYKYGSDPKHGDWMKSINWF